MTGPPEPGDHLVVDGQPYTIGTIDPKENRDRPTVRLEGPEGVERRLDPVGDEEWVFVETRRVSDEDVLHMSGREGSA